MLGRNGGCDATGCIFLVVVLILRCLVCCFNPPQSVPLVLVLHCQKGSSADGFKPCSKHAISSCASQVLEALGAAVSGAVAMGAGNWDMWGMTAGGPVDTSQDRRSPSIQIPWQCVANHE